MIVSHSSNVRIVRRETGREDAGREQGVVWIWEGVNIGGVNLGGVNMGWRD